jgi:hypothetical protein
LEDFESCCFSGSYSILVLEFEKREKGESYQHGLRISGDIEVAFLL